MTTTPNLLAARLTGQLLALAKYGALPYPERLTLLSQLRAAYQALPPLNSEAVLAEVAQLQAQLEGELHALLAEERRRDERERFRDLDGDHHEDRAEHLPEHDYPY